MSYKRKPERCHHCGNTLLTVTQYLRRVESGGYAMRCITFPDLCDACGVRELARHALLENVRRLEGWAESEGTRRNIAEVLVRAFDKHDLGTSLRHHVRWAFTWEMTGEPKELRKLVERLMPIWKDRVVVPDPVMGRVADVLQERGTARH